MNLVFEGILEGIQKCHPLPPLTAELDNDFDKRKITIFMRKRTVLMMIWMRKVRDASVPAPTTSDRDVDQGLLLQWAFGRKA